jgi:hypothetical protein
MASVRYDTSLPSSVETECDWDPVQFCAFFLVSGLESLITVMSLCFALICILWVLFFQKSLRRTFATVAMLTALILALWATFPT